MQDEFSVLVVGTGLTGAICCQHLRQLAPNIRIEAIDMARGAGGRMSTTRHKEVKGNTGAQYASCWSKDAKRVLLDVCKQSPSPLAIEPIEHPVERSLHFVHSAAQEQYTHYSIPGGTNCLVKQFLYAGGQPNVVSFETRLTKLWRKDTKIVPEFDLRLKKGTTTNLSNEYDVVILALPPKDAVKFFNTGRPNYDPQSQADLHRRYNTSKNNNPHLSKASSNSCLPLMLEDATRTKLRQVEYVGRYSLALWFPHLNNDFCQSVFQNFQHGPHNVVLDAVFLQEQGRVLVAQSTVGLWRKYSGVSAGGGRGGGQQQRGQSAGNSLHQIAGGGRQAVRQVLTMALEELAGNGQRIPKVEHAKLLNWRTSQVEVPLHLDNVLSTENGQVILTGDWCTESSLEGCYRAAVTAAKLALGQRDTSLEGMIDNGRRGTAKNVPLEGGRIVGTIDKWVAKKGFGFAKARDGQRYYLHQKQFASKSALQQAAVGVQLEFTSQPPSSDKGCHEAIGVVLVVE